MSFVKKGVVLPLGGTGNFDDSAVYGSAILERNGEVWLYYVGIAGNRARMGLAISEDGLNFVRQGLILPLGDGEEWDDFYLYPPSVLERDGKIWLYYPGHDGSKYRMGLAISDDGIHFVRQGVILPLGDNDDFDDAAVDTAAVLERDGGVWLYYTASDSGGHRVGLAVGGDGIGFVRLGVVLPLGDNGTFDDNAIFRPTVLERDGGVWLYYVGNDGHRSRIGLATSKNGIDFTKLGVVISGKAGDDFDELGFHSVCALERGGKVWLYYAGRNGEKWRIGLAISEDGL